MLLESSGDLDPVREWHGEVMMAVGQIEARNGEAVQWSTTCSVSKNQPSLKLF
jgi:hypothetical protein